MDVKLINPFIAATCRVFDMMVHVPVTLGHPRLKDADEQLYRMYHVSVAISLSGAACGAVILHLSKGVALGVVSKLTGEPVTDLDSECLDALGEVANMIAGNAKKDLPCGQVVLTVPRADRTGHVHYPSSLPLILIPMQSSFGRFAIEVAVRTNRAESAAA